MSWDTHHSNSERLALQAEAALRAGDGSLAAELYRRASEEEARAFNALPNDKQRTRGATAVSAVALSYKGQQFAQAERLAYSYLTEDKLSPFAVAQLRTLLAVIWSGNAAEKAGAAFISGDILASLKGGEITYGGAPLELIIQKIEGIKAYFFRTAEMLLNRPLRKRGAPPPDILTAFRLWLFQVPAGSYQFAIRIETDPQYKLYNEPDRPKVEQVTRTFFRLLRATADDPEKELPNIVPSEEYRKAFLNLSRNLAPSPGGQAFERLEILDAMAPNEPRAVFAADTRERLNLMLRKSETGKTASEDVAIIQGVLRALHLDRDWLEIVTTPGDGAHMRIDKATDVLDDVIGPMVNRQVIVRAIRRGQKYIYQDIELMKD